MDLTNQKVIGTNELQILDSLNAALLSTKIARTNMTGEPASDDLIIYVDTSSMSSPTSERKQYVFNLLSHLKFYNNISDEFTLNFEVENNKIIQKATIIRRIGTNEQGNYILTSEISEVLESFPITLFSGENYIYTNYENVVLEITYPRDNEFNKAFLNNSIFSSYIENHNDDLNLDDLYFKDAFTKTDNQLNFEANIITADSVESKNNNFSLDSDGNLVVRSITTIDNIIDDNAICNLIYPLGSIYMSINNVNPSALFGGTWEQLKDRFLLGAGDTYVNGTIGGSISHSHSSASHTHNLNSGYVLMNIGAGGIQYQEKQIPSWTTNAAINTNSSYGASLTRTWGINLGGNVGSTTPSNVSTETVVPPYLTVYIWKRTN